MTLFGLALCWVNFAFMAVLNPHMDAPIPPWAYIVCGLNLFVYQTLDNMDGQQARRLGVCLVVCVRTVALLRRRWWVCMCTARLAHRLGAAICDM